MSSWQQLIKYGAIAFAVFLCFMIISSIFWGVMIFSGIFIGYDNFVGSSTKVTEEYSYVDKQDQVQKLDINLDISNLSIERGEELKVETRDVSEDIEVKISNSTLYIKENSHGIWNKNSLSKAEVIVTIPEDIMFEKVDIKLGVGKSNIQNIITKKIELNCGVGVTEIESLISENTKIEGGAGKISVIRSNLGNLKMDCGVGKTTVEAKITGDSEINSGVGKTEVTLYGKESDYKLKVKKGLGRIQIENETVEDETSYGTGKNTIAISGGVGMMDIQFNETDRI